MAMIPRIPGPAGTNGCAYPDSAQCGVEKDTQPLISSNLYLCGNGSYNGATAFKVQTQIPAGSYQAAEYCIHYCINQNNSSLNFTGCITVTIPFSGSIGNVYLVENGGGSIGTVQWGVENGKFSLRFNLGTINLTYCFWAFSKTGQEQFFSNWQIVDANLTGGATSLINRSWVGQMLVAAGAVSGVTTLAMGGALSGVTTLAMAGLLSGATVTTQSPLDNSTNPASTAYVEAAVAATTPTPGVNAIIAGSFS